MNYDKSVEDYAVHLYRLQKPSKDAYAYTMEYTGRYAGEDLEASKIYNWEEYEEEAKVAVNYFLVGDRK